MGVQLCNTPKVASGNTANMKNEGGGPGYGAGMRYESTHNRLLVCFFAVLNDADDCRWWSLFVPL